MKKKGRRLATAGLDTLRYADGGKIERFGKKQRLQSEDAVPQRNMMETDDPTKGAKQVIPNVYKGPLAEPGTEIKAGSPDWQKLQRRI